MNALDDLVINARERFKEGNIAVVNFMMSAERLASYLAKNNDDLRDFLFECFNKSVIKVEQAFIIDEILEKLREKKNAANVEITDEH